MRSTLTGILLLALTGCGAASAGPATSAPSGPARHIETGTGTEIVLSPEGPAAPVPLAATADQVFAVLPAVYEEVGIPVRSVDTPARTPGNQRFVTSRRVGEMTMDKLLRCGAGITSAPTAMTHRITMRVLTSVLPGTSGGSRLQTLVEATAASNEGTSTSQVAFASTGVLEARIAALAKARLGQP